MSDKWFIIVNPNAGKKKGGHDWKGITKLLAEAGIDYMSYFTEHRGHAMELTRKYIIAGFRKFIVVGGDGTFNEVVNGIFTQSHTDPSLILLSMIPVGTGNDWCRMYNIPVDYKKAIELIRNNNVFYQDTGVLEFTGLNGRQEKRYFGNIAGMGFDAMVAEKTNHDKDKGKGNPLSYFVNIFTSLFSFKTSRTTITLDDRIITPEVFSLTAAIGRYNGGGMKQAPFAAPDDGLFDVTIISRIRKFKVIRNILTLLDGTFTRLPEVSSFKSSFVRIESNPPLKAETDGESLGQSPFVFTILPRSLRIISGGEN